MLFRSQLLEQLQQGELDAVLGRLAEPDRMMHLRFEPLWSEPLVAALHPAHPLLTLPFSQWQTLSVPLVVALPGTAIRKAADDFLASIDARPGAAVIETLEPEIGRSLAWHDHAVWFTPSGNIHDGLESLPLEPLTLPGAASEAIGLYLPADGEGDAAGGHIADLVDLVHSLRHR